MRFLTSTWGILGIENPQKRTANERRHCPPAHPHPPQAPFGFRSTAGAEAISPASAAAASATPLSGSENRGSQAELDRIAARHRLWLDRKSGGTSANVSDRDLSGLKFGRWNLRHASFAGANLFGIHATDTRFCYCDFTVADL